MLSELARIEPVVPGRSSKVKDSAQAWLQPSSAFKLVDVDILQRMQQFIDCMLNSGRR